MSASIDTNDDEITISDETLLKKGHLFIPYSPYTLLR